MSDGLKEHGSSSALQEVLWLRADDKKKKKALINTRKKEEEKNRIRRKT